MSAVAKVQTVTEPPAATVERRFLVIDNNLSIEGEPASLWIWMTSITSGRLYEIAGLGQLTAATRASPHSVYRSIVHDRPWSIARGMSTGELKVCDALVAELTQELTEQVHRERDAITELKRRERDGLQPEGETT